MKIIGNTKDGHLAEISKTELANILGFYAMYDRDFIKWVGQEGTVLNRQFSVSDIYKKTQAIRSKEGEVKSAIKTFRGMADALEMAWPALVKTNEE